jgi:hypothetical protein
MSDLPADSNAERTTQPTSNPPAPPISDLTPYKEPKSKRFKRYCNRNLPKAPIWIEAACALALVGITFAYTHYAAGQLREMRKATKATEKAANAAMDAAQSAERQRISFENSQRGQLAIEDFSYALGDSHVHYELWNRGNSLIKEIGENGPTGFGFEWVTFGDGGMASLLKKWQTMAKSNWRGFSLPAGEHRPFDVPAPTAAERRNHQPPEEIALFFGTIYTGIDIFGHDQSAVICIQSFKGGYARCLSNPGQ